MLCSPSTCSERDWTRLLRHRIKKYQDSPVHTLSDSLRIYFFPLWRADLFFSGFAVEFAGYVWTVAVSGKKSCGFKNIRIRVDGAYPDIFESATFFPDTATLHTYPANSTANPEKKNKSALQSGKNISATNPITCGRVNPDIFYPMT